MMDLRQDVVVVGGGPAGLMAAEVLQQGGLAVHLFDAMPSVGRKFLLAGRGGLNLTHSEPFEGFVSRYGARSAAVREWLQVFDATAMRNWAQGLGVQTFVGTSGRVFPTDMKAAPLLRAWLHRLRSPQSGTPVRFYMRHRWTGWSALGALEFHGPNGVVEVRARHVVLALGGGSWARLGSDGAWLALLAQRQVPTTALLPSNCGFDRLGGWSDYFAAKFAGQAFKSVAICLEDPSERLLNGQTGVEVRRGEFVATRTGVEGSLIYAVSATLRDRIAATGEGCFWLDLMPDWSLARVQKEVAHPRGARSLSSHLKSRLSLQGIKAAVLREVLNDLEMHDPSRLALAIKALPLRMHAPRPIDEAISTAGGVMLDGTTSDLMLTALPEVFCAGEMLDWEAPTGGYLLQASCASGVVAARGVLKSVAALSAIVGA